MLLYGSSLCLKTVSSLLNLALKAMKLESPAPKQSLINLSQPQGVRASYQIPLFKFRKEIFWTPGQIEYPVGSHLCESNFGLKPKSRLRIHLYNDHQLENPWPLPLKGLGLEMIGRWSTMRTKIPEFGENGNVLRFLALNWIEESKIHLSDCFLICWEKFRTKPLRHHLDRSERLSRQFSIISRVIIRAVIVQHGFSGLIFVWGNGHKKVALGAGRKRRGVDGRGGRHGGLHGELPGLSLPDTPPPLASTVNCRKCSVKPALNQNTMIRLLPIIHSWKSPETGNVSSLTGLCWGGYKRGLSEHGAGLFLARGWFILTAPMNSGD